MTLPTTISAVTYAGNGVTTQFDWTFLIPSGALEVYLTENDIAVLVDASAYSASGLDDPNGGTVTFAEAPALGQTITIKRNVALTQDVALVTGSAFYAEVVEGAFDRATMQIQQLAEEMGRAVQVPIGSGLDPTDYLDAAARSAAAAAGAAATATAAETVSVAARDVALESRDVAVAAKDAALVALEQANLGPATTEKAGVSRQASVEEAVSGISAAGDGAYVTPEGLAAKTATTERVGLAELATDAETVAGADAGRTVTPAGLAAALAARTKVFAYGGLKTASFTVADADMFKRFRIAPAAAMTVTLPAPAEGGLVLLGIENASYTVTLAAASATTKIYGLANSTAWSSTAGSSVLALVVGEVWLWSDGVDWWAVDGIGTRAAARFYSKGDTTKTGAVYSNTGFKLANGTDIGALFTAYGAVCNCNCQCDCGGP